MPIEIKNQEVLIRLPKERLDAAEKVFEQALSDEATRIVVRARKGLDVDGNPMDELSPAYAKYKAKKGRRPEPDMTFSGNMLAALTSKVERLGEKIVGTIFFNSAREALKAQGNQRLRRFFGLAEEQVRRITEKLRSARR